MKKIVIKILETYEELTQVEELQHQVWTGTAIDVVPAHMMLAVIHNGGVAIGAYEVEDDDRDEIDVTDVHGVDSFSRVKFSDALLAGFVFGFPGIYQTPDGPKLKHHSHMMGVLETYRDKGIGYLLKRAQWQMVRRQNLDRITWTYDPLLSRNANLNISRLGAVCSTYFKDYYGEMRDGMNKGVSSDRFQVDLWVNSQRVVKRLSKKPRLKLDLAHFLAAQTPILNPTIMNSQGLPVPTLKTQNEDILSQITPDEKTILLVEIPADYFSLKSTNLELADLWRRHTREIFTTLFENGYLITDFIHLAGTYPRSFYVLSYGESTL